MMKRERRVRASPIMMILMPEEITLRTARRRKKHESGDWPHTLLRARRRANRALQAGKGLAAYLANRKVVMPPSVASGMVVIQAPILPADQNASS